MSDVDAAVAAIANFVGWGTAISAIEALMLSGFVAERFGLTSDDQLEVARRFGQPARDGDEPETPPLIFLHRCPSRHLNRGR